MVGDVVNLSTIFSVFYWTPGHICICEVQRLNRFFFENDLISAVTLWTGPEADTEYKILSHDPQSVIFELLLVRGSHSLMMMLLIHNRFDRSGLSNLFCVSDCL